MSQSVTIRKIMVSLTTNIAFFYFLSVACLGAPATELLQTNDKYTPTQLAVAEAQVKKMLLQLPEMSRLVSKDDLMWSWAVRQFAGDAAGENIIWSSASTVSPEYVSEHLIPFDGKPGSIQMNSLDELGNNHPGEKLWYYFCFECFNIANHKRFHQIYCDAIEGKLDENSYIRRCTELEFKALHKTYLFYTLTYKPFMDRKCMKTNPILWGSMVPKDYELWISQYKDHAKYPWSSYAKYFNETIVPYRRAVDEYEAQQKGRKQEKQYQNKSEYKSNKQTH